MKLARKQIALMVAILVLAAGIGFAITYFTSPARHVKNDGSHIVNLTATGADPDAIAIVRGSYVEFDAKDGRSHNIGEGSAHPEHTSTSVKSAHDSGIFGPGYGYRVSFREVGTYQFFDHLNPKVKVTVIVYEPAKKK